MRRWIVCSALLVSCAVHEKPDLPPVPDVRGLYGSSRNSADLTGVGLQALYVLPEKIGIAAEDHGVPLLEVVAVLSNDGQLYLADNLHVQRPAAYQYGKLSMDS